MTRMTDKKETDLLATLLACLVLGICGIAVAVASNHSSDSPPLQKASAAKVSHPSI